MPRPLNIELGGTGTNDGSTLRGGAYVVPANYGAVGDGVADDTAALQAAATAAANKTLILVDSYLITSAITLSSNTTIWGEPGCLVKTATNDIDMFVATSKTNIRIRGVHFKRTSAGNGVVGDVHLLTCTLCEVSGCEFEGSQWSAVYLDSSNDCTVMSNYIHDALSSAAGDKNDIAVYKNSSYNLVAYNRCYGGTNSFHGVLCQDPGGVGTYLPQHNKITRNLIKAHSAYGVAVYIGGTQVSYNDVVGNDVEGITGSANSGSTGTGIYCVGEGLGGLQVQGNTVRNCCTATTSTSNAPAGISITGNANGDVKPVIIGNVVDNMQQANGIGVVSCPGGAVVQGNSVRLPSNNDGTGAGGASLLGAGVKIQGSSNVILSGNSVKNDGTSDAIFVLADTTNFGPLAITNNDARCASGNALRIDRLSTFIYTDVSISGNTLRTDGTSSAYAISIVGADRVAITGNSGSSNTQAALNFNATTNCRVANNSMNTNGTNSVVTAGTCTNSFYDISNQITGVPNNGGTGFLFHLLLTATPTTGTYVRGDHWTHATPAASTKPGEYCTTSGTPGTWKAEANLAA